LVPYPLGSNDGEIEFVIENGQSFNATARLLSENNLVIGKLPFVMYSVLTGNDKTHQAGSYLLKQPLSIYSLSKMFSKGLSVNNDLQVTIPEGSNLSDVSEILEKVGILREPGEFVKYAASEFVEGYLFPDTYRFHDCLNQLEDCGYEPQEIISMMLGNFKNKTEFILAGLDPEKTKEAIIIASMLEKEVRSAKDMRLVSGIIRRRIKIGMPLQIDATVAYGACYDIFLKKKNCNTSHANIVDNIKIDSVYNTYTRLGLPEGPISNPGMTAIGAALNPEASEYLFYLSAKDGTTIFSKTSSEHEENRIKYLR